MFDQLNNYITFIFHEIPTSCFVGFGTLLLVGTVFFLFFRGPKKGLKWSAELLLFEYIVLLVILAVLARKVNATRTFNFTPFWSYRAILDGAPYLMEQVIANIVAFIPIGFLLRFVFDRIRWVAVMLIGLSFSVLIEFLQFVLKRGFTEFDDLFHNVLGCLIGYGLYCWFSTFSRVEEKRNL